MKNKTKNNSSAAKTAFVGATLAGLAAAGYFLLGSKNDKNQQHAKAWAVKMKADVIEKLEKAREISEPVYHEIIDAVAAVYEKGNKADREDISALTQDLKKHWQTLVNSAQTVKREIAKEAGKTVKQVGKSVKVELKNNKKKKI